MDIVSTGQWTAKGVDQLLVEGAPHGAAVTVILEDMPPGAGPRLHWHPYGETWVVVDGRIAFSDGEATREASAGDVIHVAPRQPHKFTAVGDTRIRMVCIHHSPVNETHWLEGPSGTALS